MRIMLINPIIDGDYNSLHLGLASLASYLNAKSEHNASILDFSFRRKTWKRYLRNRINSDKPDIIGIYVSTALLNCVMAIAKEIKLKYGLPIIVGGHHATLLPEKTLAMETIDMLAIGEAEETLNETLDRIEKGKSLNGVKGLWFKDKGKIIQNPLRTLNQRLGEYPPLDWSIWNDLEKQLYFFEFLPLIGNRGCKHHCTFCSVYPIRNKLNGKYYREKSPKLVVAEAKEYWSRYPKRGMKFIRFSEPIFTHNIRWVRAFHDEYIKQGMKGRPFSVYSRADEFDEEKAFLLSEIGCKVLRVGIENADEMIRNQIYEKGISRKQILEVGRLCKKYDIQLLGYFVFGGPKETKQTMKKTYRLMKEIGVDLPTILLLRPFPKTRLMEKIEESNYWIKEDRWNQIYNLYEGAMVEGPCLCVNDIEFYQKKIYFFIMLRSIFKEIKYWKLSFFTGVFNFILNGLKEGMPFSVIMRCYLSRRHLE